jgi:hypothetical protein
MITDYTSFEDVRAALGVSEEEIADETLGLESVSTLLDEDLLEINSDLPTIFADLAADEANWTAKEKRLHGLIRLYATYAVAFRLLDSAALFGFLQVADGRASTSRVPDAYKNLRADVTAMLGRVKAKLITALLAVFPGTTVPTLSTVTFFSAVGTATDPVTGT